MIFELYNEPIWTEWSAIKAYHEAVLPVVRSFSENLALLGTRRWSQDVDEAADDPVDFDNVAYVVHFYAAQPEHGAALRAKVQRALDRGVAVFASEWASVEANGDGAPDVDATRTWLSLLAANAISHAMWSIHDKDEGASILQPGTD
ncbi:MAG: cellulase family glycosylhydrolase, partial [Myxococcota bacterium]